MLSPLLALKVQVNYMRIQRRFINITFIYRAMTFEFFLLVITQHRRKKTCGSQLIMNQILIKRCKPLIKDIQYFLFKLLKKVTICCTDLHYSLMGDLRNVPLK